MSIKINIDGIDELTSAINSLVKEYPDEMEMGLRRVALGMKRSTVQKMRERTREHTGNLVKKGVKVDKVKGYGSNLSVDIYGNQPHFHLIENGHEIIDPKTGENKGFAPGKHMMADTITEYREKYPEEMEKLVVRVIKKKGLNK